MFLPVIFDVKPVSGISPPFCNCLYHSELIDFRCSCCLFPEVESGLSRFIGKNKSKVELLHFNPYRPMLHTRTATNQLICNPNQLTGFYVCNMGLIWVKVDPQIEIFLS